MAVCLGLDQDSDGDVVIGLHDCIVSNPNGILIGVLQSAKEEDIIKNSSLGELLVSIIDQLLKLDLVQFAQYLANEIKSILTKSLKPSKKNTVILSSVWRNFHCLRLSTNIKCQWMIHFRALHLSEELPLAKLSDMVLQVILTRMMRAVINQVKSSESTAMSSITPLELTMRVKNAIR